MRRKSLIVALLTALVLCGVLVGCGGSGAEATAENFVGTWALDSLEEDGEPVGQDSLAMAQAMGVYLVINEDNTATVELFGIEVSGTWSVKDATTITIKPDASEATDADEADLEEVQDVTYADGKLTMTADDETMTFKKIDPSEKKTGDLGSVLGDLGDASGELASEEDVDDDLSAALEDASELDVVVADDGVCTIGVSAKGSYYGDPGYLLTVTNHTDVQVKVDDNNEFSVGGAVLSPVFSMILEPGETRREILWFSTTDLEDAGLSGLEGASGQLVVTNYDTGEQLGVYDFAV